MLLQVKNVLHIANKDLIIKKYNRRSNHNVMNSHPLKKYASKRT